MLILHRFPHFPLPWKLWCLSAFWKRPVCIKKLEKIRGFWIRQDPEKSIYFSQKLIYFHYVTRSLRWWIFSVLILGSTHQPRRKGLLFSQWNLYESIKSACFCGAHLIPISCFSFCPFLSLSFAWYSTNLCNYLFLLRFEGCSLLYLQTCRHSK